MKTNETNNAGETRTQDLAAIFAAAVNRTDQWRELHALSRAWATAQGAQAESQRAETAGRWNSLTRLEQCWACLVFPLRALYFEMEATSAALVAISVTSVFRLLAIQFNWVTPALWRAPEQST